MAPGNTPRLARAIFEHVQASPSNTIRFDSLESWARRQGLTAREARLTLGWIEGQTAIETYQRGHDLWVRTLPGAQVPPAEPVLEPTSAPIEPWVADLMVYLGHERGRRQASLASWASNRGVPWLKVKALLGSLVVEGKATKRGSKIQPIWLLVKTDERRTA